MSVSILRRKLARNIEDHGVCAALGKGMGYLFKKVYARRTYRIYRVDPDNRDWPEEAPEGITLRAIAEDDREAIRQIEDMQEWLQGKIPGILSHGLCIVAFDGPLVAGFNLVTFGEVLISLINLRHRLRPDQAWSEQIAVLKPYRNRGLASALRYRVFRELQRRGIRMFYGGTLASNLPSVKSAEKAGFRFIVDVEYLKLLSREYRTYKRTNHVAC